MKEFACLLAVALACLATLESHALSDDQFSYSSYFRTGIGRSDKGGSQSCFTNPLASDHNDFRLGNECGAYSELVLRGMPVKGKADEPFFAAETMFSFAPPNQGNGEPANLQVREIFIEGGNIFGKGYGYWIGKRYYRDLDAHMSDFFYYAGITGNGAGVTNMNTGYGKLSVALFLNSINDGLPATSSTLPVDSSYSAAVGTPEGRYIDVRLAEMPLTDKDQLNLWLGAADQSATDITSGRLAGKRLGNFFGSIIGTRYRRNLEHGANDFSAILGYGLLSRFNTENAVGFVAGDPIGKAKAIRVLDHATIEHADWGAHLIANFELRQNYYASDKKGWYFSTGVRPVYFFNEHFQFAVELGHDESHDDGISPDRTLRMTRITFAPEIVAAKKIWSRPALRFFYTASFWNNGARGLIGGLPYVNATNGMNWGFQGEIWF